MKKKTELIIRTDNQDITISWMLVWARYRCTLTVHQMRLILRILEFCQEEIKGVKFKDILRQLEYQKDDVVLRMPYTDVYFSNFTLKTIRNDLKNLRDSSVEFYDYVNKVWNVCGIIEKPYVYEGTGMMEFKIDLQFWNQLRNLAHGIRRCELSKALALPTVYSMWFYIYISEKNEPMYITIEHLKERLGISEVEYKDSKGNHRIDNLEARVILPSKKYLDRSCPYTFLYEKIRENPKSKRSPVKLLRFIPVYQPQYRDEKLERKALVAKTSVSMLSPQVFEYLTKTMGFGLDKLQPNKETLAEAIKYIPNIMEKLSSLQGRRRLRDGSFKDVGWVINALKSEIENVKKRQDIPRTVTTDNGYIADLFDANR